VCSPAIETQLAQLEAQGKTVIVLTDGNEPLILLAVADTIKDSSRVAIRNLHELGIETVMLTGDLPVPPQPSRSRWGSTRHWATSCPRTSSGD
jgi:Cd2+/Zn2+-exporting ATPase